MMTILQDDSFSRRGGIHRPQSPRPGIGLFALILLSLTLLVLSRLDHAVIKFMRAQITEFVAPALSLASVPLQPLRDLARKASTFATMAEDLQRLRAENKKLKGWEWRAKELERRMAQLGALARVVEEPALEYVTGRVIADASGPFVRIAMINAGTNNAIRNGNPAINSEGLVGRIVDSGRSASRLLLLTDLNSRVPVLVGSKGYRGLLLGDNSPLPKLGYLPRDAVLAAGDEIITSGVGGMFPRGLRIGRLEGEPGKLSVALHAALDELEYVSVLLFKAQTVELSAQEKGRKKAAGVGLNLGKRNEARDKRTQ